VTVRSGAGALTGRQSTPGPTTRATARATAGGNHKGCPYGVLRPVPGAGTRAGNPCGCPYLVYDLGHSNRRGSGADSTFLKEEEGVWGPR